VESVTSQVFSTARPDTIQEVERPVDVVTVLQGIRSHVAPGTEVIYAPGCDILGDSRDGFAEAVEAARRADVAVLVMGDKAGLTAGCTSGESRDRALLGLPGVQEELVRR